MRKTRTKPMTHRDVIAARAKMDAEFDAASGRARRAHRRIMDPALDRYRAAYIALEAACPHRYVNKYGHCTACGRWMRCREKEAP